MPTYTIRIATARLAHRDVTVASASPVGAILTALEQRAVISLEGVTGIEIHPEPEVSRSIAPTWTKERRP